MTDVVDHTEPDHTEPYRAPRKRGSRAGLSDAAVTGIDLDGAGSAEIVEIAKINVDADYQRALRHDLVNKIAREYDIVKAGPILLSAREDGSLWCVDGQHRMAGAEQAGEKEIFAHVVHGLTKEEEAELRLARNERKSDTIAEKYQTRMVMGDPIAEAMTEIVLQHGSHINVSPVASHGINAIATVELLYNLDQGGWLGRTLKVLNDAYADDTIVFDDGSTWSGIDPETASTSMLKALTWFLGQHVDSKEVPYGEFIERLRVNGPEDIRRKAVSHKAANGGTLWVNYYRALVEIWNYRRQDRTKIKWKTIGSLSTLGAQNAQPRAPFEKLK